MTDNPFASPNPASDTSAQKKGPSYTFIKLLAVLGILVILVGFLLPVTRMGALPAARRTQCSNNLKQIALALLSYQDTFDALPPAYTVDADGKPLHSWRTLILPYLEQTQLYAKIDLSKPWNDPANAEAYNTRMDAFRCPEVDCPVNHTTYMAIVASNGCFLPSEPRQLSEVTDVHGETLMVIEVAAEQAVHWMAPVDADEQMVLGFGPNSKLAHTGGTNAAFVDGSVRFLLATMSAAERRALISIAGNDK